MADLKDGLSGTKLNTMQSKQFKTIRMTVRKEVIEKCEQMVMREITAKQVALKQNKLTINRLAKEQRIMKAQIGVLYQMRNDLRPKKV